MSAADKGRSNFANQVAIVSGARICNVLAITIAYGLMARGLGPDLMGRWATIVLTINLVITVGQFGLGAATVYFGSRDPLSIPSLAVNSVLTGLVAGLAGGLFVAALQPVLGANIGLDWWAFGAIVIVGTSSGLVRSFLQDVLRTQSRYFSFALTSTARPVSFLIAILILRQADSLDAGTALASWILAEVIALVGVLSATISTVRAGRPDTELLRRSFSFGIRLHPGNVLQILSYRADLFVVSVMLGPASAGIYVAATSLSERVWEFPHAIRTALVQRLSATLNAVDQRLVLGSVSRPVSLVVATGCVALVLLRDQVIALAYGPEFAEAASIIVILAPGIWALSMYKIHASYFISAGRPLDSTLIALYSFLTMAVLNLALIPRFGLEGSAAATSIAYVLSLALGTRQISEDGERVPMIVPRAEDFRNARNVLRKLRRA